MHKPSGKLISPIDEKSGAGGHEVGEDGKGAMDEARGAEEEEVRKPKIAKRHYTPTREEVEAHLPLQLEYRSWCLHCRYGKGISMQHRSDEKHVSDEMGVTVSLDYCFMTPEEIEQDMRAILVMYDHSKHGLWALPVSRNGAQEEVVNWIAAKLEESGYGGVQVTLKSDQEPAMISLKQAVAVKRKAETPLIEFSVRESKSNGRIERAIRKWQSQFRTIRHHVESRLGEKLENDSPIIEWMVVWVADAISKYSVKDNGRTTYEMITQHSVKHKVVGFAEKVDYMMKISSGKRNACSNEKTGTGYFIGIVNRNTQYLVATKDGIVTRSTVRRYPDEQAYHKECKDIVKVMYSEYIKDGARTVPLTVSTPPAMAGPGMPDPNPIKTNYAPRAVRLAAKDFTRFGYTGGCAGCESIATGLGGRKGHSVECRLRMEDVLANDNEGQEKLKNADERRQKWIAQQVEQEAEQAVGDAQACSEGGINQDDQQRQHENVQLHNEERGETELTVDENERNPKSTANRSHEPMEVAIHTPVGTPSKKRLN